MHINQVHITQMLQRLVQNSLPSSLDSEFKNALIANLSGQTFDIIWSATHDERNRDLIYDLDESLGGSLTGDLVKRIVYHAIGDIYSVALDEDRRRLILSRKLRSHPKKEYLYEPNCCDVTMKVENYIGKKYPEFNPEETKKMIAHLTNECFPIIWDACHDNRTHILYYNLDNEVSRAITANTIKGVVRQFVGDIYDVAYNEANNQLQLIRHH